MKENVAQSWLTLCNPMDYTVQNSLGQNTGVGSLSFLQGIFLTQGSDPGIGPRDRTQVSCIAGRFFTSWATREAKQIKTTIYKVDKQQSATVYPLINQIEKNLQKNTCIYITGLLFCTPEMNTRLKINYIPIKKKWQKTDFVSWAAEHCIWLRNEKSLLCTQSLPILLSGLFLFSIH